MGAKKKSKVEVSTIPCDDDDPDSPEKCCCGVNVHTGALIVGFLGFAFAAIGFVGSWYMNKVAECFIEGFSMFSYFMVFYGRLKNNRHWYLPLLLVHALAIPILTIVGVLFILVNLKMLRASEFPLVIHLKFSLDITTEGMTLTAYNALTSLINCYFLNIVTRSYLFMRRTCPKRKKMRVVRLV
ncbi:hypothetical protein M3Y94_00878800 [Aphelenchoides besseyi]|nr:hypothetical protein M3Y94_00878800 [Aphelenchoides besseyi]KAI6226577.1 hypothetical protein M3Y95_00635600 [Aphelenchoides besseyi]